MSRTPRFLALVLATLALPALLHAAAPREHRIFLTADAPFGAKAARTWFAPVCGDTVHRDTLYLCFEPARDESLFYGFSGEILVYAAPGDTLGGFWQMERGGANNGGMIAQFGPDESFPQPQPWGTQGVGTVLYDRTASSGRFRFLYAVPTGGAQPVKAGKLYVLGRIVLGQRHAAAAGCERPVCIEWHKASLAFRASGEEQATLGDARWVHRGPGEGDCRGRIPAWRPKTSTP